MGKKPQIAVLLANTGTPDDPSPEAVRRYLRDYLKDRRIVEMPPFIWLPILYGTVLPRRSIARSGRRKVRLSLFTREKSRKA